MTEQKNRPDIKITCCTECGYDFLAKALAVRIEERFHLTTTLEAGHGGIYAINLDDEEIYNNLNHGGVLPEDEEILSAIESLIVMPGTAKNSVKLKVFDPTGFPPAIEPAQMASRLDNLDGKLIYLVDARFNDSDRFLLQMQRWFQEHLPQTRTKFVRKAGVYTEEDTRLFEEIRQHGDAMVMAVGH